MYEVFFLSWYAEEMVQWVTILPDDLSVLLSVHIGSSSSGSNALVCYL